MSRHKLFLFLFICLPYFLSAQSTDSVPAPSVNTKRLSLFAAGASVVYSTSLVGLSKVWYKNSQYQDFHFFNDNSEWKQLDKVGHFYSSFYISCATSRALHWSGVRQSKSVLIGSVTGFMVMLPIEILDGYSKDYGASPGDLLANASGAAFHVVQSSLWKEIRIWPKFSFHRTNYAQIRPEVLGNNLISEILKDYNGQTHWLSFDMDKFIKFPRWLNLAAGYGAQEMVYAQDSQNRKNGYDPYRQYYLSIDFDLTAIKTRSKVLKTVIFFANMIKLPAPSLEFSKKGIRFHTLYF